ncbi:HD family phosphohydrolase [Desulfovibrio ferrophilus]|uniref:7TM receptor with intracellular metal dependent phosphohydrolase n=1 Tax=Desulfovibrio ferrophilus TaxID=241368 RepID=A0A2Z6AUR3_9BACT|nr:HDIG domain-containing metalloprotein [Desulfovibrio ferrophilus]BBD06982.1 7TM receptor with intracellular metal dependent phosphohydrolase [Desulfovibrio ferrophilus]
MSATKKPRTKKKGNRPNRSEPASVPRTVASGVGLFLFTLLLLSALAGVKFSSGPPLYLAGDIAEQDVTAQRDLLVEDVDATRLKRQQAAEAQPSVFDLDMEPFAELEQGVRAAFLAVNSATTETMEDVRWQVAEDLNAEISKSTVAIWQREDFQNLVLARVLPWMHDYLQAGVVESAVALDDLKSGFVMRDLVQESEILRTDLGAVADIRSLRSDLALYMKRELKKPLVIRKATWALVGPLVQPSLAPSPAETSARVMRAMEAVTQVYIPLREGQIVVRQGEAVTTQQQLKLQAMFNATPQAYTVQRAVGIFMISILLGLGLALCQRAGLCQALGAKDYVLLSMVLLLFGGLAKFLSLTAHPLGGRLASDIVAYSLPVPAAAGVLALFLPYAVSIFSLIIVAFLCTQMPGGDLALFSFYFVGGLLQIFVVKRAETRSELLASVLPLLAGLSLAWIGVSFMDYKGLNHALAGGAYVLAGGVVSLILVLSLAPIVELLLGYTSRFRLMELMSLEQPLMQELMVTAPGTYHHSIILSNMVEAGARAIGANSLLAKVAALYHDVGKLSKPLYFIENQMGGENKHDKLAPSMSALILTSHVKKGVEMAREHKLGQEIEDLIQQHHGTMLISYFYHRATEQAEAKGEEPPREEEFRYPGPRPQTKEAGLLLLADAIEASSRTLVEPTPSRIKGHIETIIKKIFTDGQLDESELTLKDMHEISEVFHRILTGIFHQRIEYPSADKDKSADSDDRPAGKNGENQDARTTETPVDKNVQRAGVREAHVSGLAKSADGESNEEKDVSSAKDKGGRSGHNPEQDPTGQTSHRDARDGANVLKFSKTRGNR